MQTDLIKHCRMFIGGITPETNEASMRNYFNQWGDLVECRVMRDSIGRSRGYGFITYKEPDSVDQAQEHRPHTIDGREVTTKRAMPREEIAYGSEQSVNRMFVGGLNDTTTKDMVRECFQQYGTIMDIDMIKDKGSSKTWAFCYVTFDDYDPVDKCVLIKWHTYGEQTWRVEKASKCADRDEKDQDQDDTKSLWCPAQGLGMNQYRMVGVPGMGFACSHMQAVMTPVPGGFWCSWAQSFYTMTVNYYI